MRTILLFLFISLFNLGYSQSKHYVCISPNVALNSTIKDPENLFGVTVEVGKYVGTTSLGIVSGFYSLRSDSVYSEFIVTVPISNQVPLSVSTGLGWFYVQKEITMEYDINYVFQLKDKLLLIVTFNNQSAFGVTSQSLCVGLNKDF
jgi:hypothetical protein